MNIDVSAIIVNYKSVAKTAKCLQSFWLALGDYHGEAIDIGFNVNYLMDGLSSIHSELAIFSFGNPNSSILITSADDLEFRYVVMPMRI